MAIRFVLPINILQFTPCSTQDAPGLISLDPITIQLVVETNGLIARGSYSTLYEQTVQTVQHPNKGERVAFKVFNQDDKQTIKDAYAEYKMLRDFDGLGGHSPKAIAFGYAKGGDSSDAGYPTIAQEYMPGVSVRAITEGYLASLSSNSNRIEQVLQIAWSISVVCNQLVDFGVRHGDLSYTNVFINQRTKTHSTGRKFDAVVIDYGQAALKRDISTYKKEGTNFFSAPELFGPNHKTTADRGRSSADTYSVGALMAFMLLREEYDDEDSFFRSYNDAASLGKTEILRWSTLLTTGNKKLAKVVASVIEACMRYYAFERPAISTLVEILETLCTKSRRNQSTYNEITRRLNRMQGINQNPLPPNYRIRPNLMLAGRYGEMQLIARKLSSHRVAYIHGFGGIGKTTLAKAFASQSSNGSTYYGVSFRRVYFVSFDSSMKETLAKLAPKYVEDTSEGDQYEMLAQHALSAMEGSLKESDLVILDDFYQPKKTLQQLIDALFIRMISDGSYHLIITSRYPAAGLVQKFSVPIGSLDDDVLESVFVEQLCGQPLQKEYLSQLFEVVQRNTLAVKLVGGLIGQSAGMVQLKDVIDALAHNELDDDSFDSYPIGSDEDSELLPLRARIKKLLDLSGLSPNEQKLMSRLLITPPQGIRKDTIENAIKKENPKLASSLGPLVSKGWVEQRPEDVIVSIHPLVRDVCLDAEGRRPLSVEAERYLDTLWEISLDALENGDLTTTSDVEASYGTAIELMRNEVRESRINTLLKKRAHLLGELGRTSEQLYVLEELSQRLEQTLESLKDAGDSSNITQAKVLCDLCQTYDDIRRYPAAISTATKALALLGWTSDATQMPNNTSIVLSGKNDLALIAELLTKRGNAVQDLWTATKSANLNEALIDEEQALKIVEAIGNDSWQRANILHTYAYIENCIPRLKKDALKHIKEAIDLIESCNHRSQREHDILYASSLNYLGYFLCGPNGPKSNDDLHDSLIKKEKAAHIRYQLLDPMHMEIARSHSNITLTLKYMGLRGENERDLEDALTHALIASKIRAARLSAEFDTSSKLVSDNIQQLKAILNIDDNELEARREATVIPSSYQRSYS